MAQPGTVPVSAPIDTYASGNTYPTHKANRGLGGYMTTANLTTLAAISADRREQGMCVYVISEGKEYRLEADLITWVVADPAGIDPNDLMLKSVYDPNDDGSVVNSDQLQGQNGAYYLSRANHTGTQAQSTVTNLVSDLAAKEPIASIGTNGHAAGPLSGGLIPLSQIPFASTAYLGLYNASTNTPAILNGTGTAGQFYIANVIGNAYAPVNVTVANQIVVYNGATWEVGATFSGGITQLTTNAGVQVGPNVTLNNTSYLVDSTGKRFVTDNVQAGLNASPNAVTAANPVATQADLASIIVVGNGVFLPELYSNGETLGDGTLRTLTSLGYNNGTAAAAWPKVNSAYTINVNTMSIDWIAWQEAMLNMRDLGFSKITTPGGRGYCPNQSIVPPFDQLAISLYRRSKKFIFDLAGSAFANRTGAPLRIFDKYPANQAEANGLQLDYSYTFENATFYGNNSALETDCAIRLGGTSGSRFKNLNFEQCGIGTDLQFCLQVKMEDCESTDHGKYGVALRDGLWNGAGADIAQSNNNMILGFRSYAGTGKAAEAAIYLNGNRNTYINNAGFEGDSGSVHQIFYDYNGATTVKNLLILENIDFENAGASRAGVRVRSNSGQMLWRAFNNQVSSASMPVLLEAEEAGQPATNPINILLEWAAFNLNTGWKLRSVGSPAWTIANVEMANNGTIFDSANWATNNGGSIPAAGKVRYTAKL